MNGLIREQDHRTAKLSKNEKRELQKESVSNLPTVPIGGGKGGPSGGTREILAQNFFAFKSPKTFGIQAKDAFATRSVALLHEL